MGVLHYFGATIGLGLIVIGAGLGIGKFAAAAAEGIARQPGAADKITAEVTSAIVNTTPNATFLTKFISNPPHVNLACHSQQSGI